jgi:ADP-ribosylglycohydrolase
VNKLCRSLIRGDAWDEAVQQCGGFAGLKGPDKNGGFAPDVLRAALFFVSTSAGFSEALGRSLAFSGPANYCPVLVGAIGGARWGASAIPPSSLAHVEILPRVETGAHRLAAGWAKDLA